MFDSRVNLTLILTLNLTPPKFGPAHGHQVNLVDHQVKFGMVKRYKSDCQSSLLFSSLLFSSLLFSSGQTAVKLSGAEAADRAQCAAPD